jgi:hypothetical protein
MHLGEKGHIVAMTKQAIIDGTLPCQKKLPWLTTDNGNYLTSIYNNLFDSHDYIALRGPFWHRLYRCSDSDVEQLNYFHSTQQKEMNSYHASDPLDYSTGYALNTGSIELYSQAGNNSLSYDEVVEIDVRQLTIEAADIKISFARDVSGWPQSDANSIVRQFAKPTVPVHVFVGTLDSNTPVGQSQWLKDNMGEDVDTTVYIVPYASHGIVDYTNLCATGIVVDILSLKSDVNFTCLYTSVSAPDWDGSSEETRNGISMAYLGTTDLWNNGYLEDSADTTDDSTIIASSDSSCNWSQSDVSKLVVAIVLPLVLVIIFLLGCICYVCMDRKRMEKSLLHSDKNGGL